MAAIAPKARTKNRVIKEQDLNMIYTTGPGQGSLHSHGRRTDDCALGVPRTRTGHGQ
jgi:hypothetical protein